MGLTDTYEPLVFSKKIIDLNSGYHENELCKKVVF